MVPFFYHHHAKPSIVALGIPVDLHSGTTEAGLLEHVTRRGVQGCGVTRSLSRLDAHAKSIYIYSMITWDEDKRQANIAKHGIDFLGAEMIFDFPTVTREDDRRDYGEQRLQSLALLAGRVVVVVWTERENSAHIISIRKAERHEQRIYFQATSQ